MRKNAFGRCFLFWLVLTVMVIQTISFLSAKNLASNFPDLEGHYAKNVIDDWANKGFVLGSPDGRFYPSSSITRAEFLTLLNKAFKPVDENGIVAAFKDVAKKQWYYDDIMLATKIGIVTGYDDGKFGPDDPISRQDACVIISRFLGLAGIYDNAYLAKFPDQEEISGYAKTHVASMAEHGFVSGRTDGSFVPTDNITRADSIIMLNNVYKVIAEGAGITGKVYVEDNALPGAVISISKKGEYMPASDPVTTDDKGLFKLELSDGVYDLVVAKDNKVAFKNDILVREDYKTYIKIDVKDGQQVSGTLKDVNNNPISDTIIYFKSNLYFHAISGSKGDFSLCLPKNEGFECFYQKDGGLVNWGEFWTTDAEELLLGDVKTLLGDVSSAKSGSSSGRSTVQSYTVLFDLNYEGATGKPISQSVAENGLVTKPADPHREGFVFSGWYKEAAGENIFEFSHERITTDTRLYAKWNIAYPSAEVLSINASILDIEINTTQDVRFEVEVSEAIMGDRLYIVDENDYVVGELTDDGEGADDIANDNVFSGVFPLRSDTVKKAGYFAKIGAGNKSPAVVHIYFYRALTDEAVTELESIDNALSELEDCFAGIVDGEDDLELITQIYEQITACFDNFVETGEVVEYIIEGEHIQATLRSGITYVYTLDLSGEGVLSGKREPAQQVIGLKEADIPPFITQVADKKVVSLQPFGLQGGQAVETAADFVSSSKFGFSPYMHLTDSEVTVKNLKHLGQYNVIILAGHGGYSTDLHSYFGTGEKLSDSALKNYSADFSGKRLVAMKGGNIAVTPKFFDRYYKRDSFKNALVYLGCCKGANDSVLAETLISKGVDTVLAYRDSVFKAYEKEMVTTFFKEMSKGSKGNAASAAAALKTAKDKHGEEDPTQSYFLEWLVLLYNPQRSVLMLFGNPHFKLDYEIATGPNNFSFEEGLKNWTTSGDCRVISALGILKPTDGKYMAIVGTGLGSVNESNSTLSRTFTVPEDTKYFKLDYNFVSEEPMEFYGSIFDDTLTFSIIAGGITHEVKRLTVNTSAWEYLGGSYFQGGDDTTYHTGWSELEIALDDYGHMDTFTLAVNIYDEGDSEYDSAVLLDNLRFSD